MRVQERQPPRSGFTLVEILVVLAIILLASLIALPTIVTNLNGRQVTDAARIFSGALVGARDSAIRYNEPRGIRLLPDPTLTINDPTSGINLQLCYNRIIPIEPAGDYSEGRISIGPQYYAGGTPDTTTFPPTAYTKPNGTMYAYPFPESPAIAKVLMVEEAPYLGGFSSPVAQPNSPTNWYWNVRVGDKIKIGGTGRSYTIVGPCAVNPLGTGIYKGNPEMFVNVGAPGTDSPLQRAYYPPPDYTVTPDNLVPYAKEVKPQFLLLVNGEDDDSDGYVDEGFDGFDNDNDGVVDELDEWETEKWVGALTTDALLDLPTLTPEGSPSAEWIYANFQKGTQDVPYIIQRQPVPSPGAREVMLPAGMVIDATTWNSTRERSRIPISLGSLNCDILVNPNGLYIPTTEYSSPTSANPLPFLHFWITDRNDVHPRGALWGLTSGVPNHNTSDPASSVNYVYYELPMTVDALASDTTNAGFDVMGPGNYPPSGSPTFPVLKNDRRLVTMFAQSGLVVTNTIESVPRTFNSALTAAQQPLVLGEGFKISDVSYPFLKAQQGLREAR